MGAGPLYEFLPRDTPVFLEVLKGMKATLLNQEKKEISLLLESAKREIYPFENWGQKKYRTAEAISRPQSRINWVVRRPKKERTSGQDVKQAVHGDLEKE